MGTEMTTFPNNTISCLIRNSVLYCDQRCPR